MQSLFRYGLLILVLLSLTAPIVLALKDDQSLYTPAEIKRNAQRKALGLPPLKPKSTRKRVKPISDRLANVLVYGNDKKAVMSPFSLPVQTSAGYIAVHRGHESGPLIGYLNNHKVVPTIQEAAYYSYGMTGALTEISLVDSNLRMCVSTGLYGKTLAPDSKNFHLPRHTTRSTPAGDSPYYDSDAAMHLETTVFSIDALSGEIGVHWINPDGSRPHVQIALRDTRIYYTGNLFAFQEAVDVMNVESVVFKWVEAKKSS